MATKYVSSLTGSEMDSALLDMAYHNSEAYAVGTRNGVAVGSSDVTYHNNSKYWAEQVYGYTDRAEDAANRAESAVPSGTAGAVFFDRAQTLTSAQQAQARANIMAGGSNRNLLDNPFFTVNQRGFTSGNMGALVYWADRWMNNTDTTNPSTLSLNNGIVTITTPSGTGRFGNILQTLADPNTIDGKVVTLSALKSDGTIISGTATRVNGTTQDLYSAYGITLRLTGTNRASLQVDNGASISIKAMKLELGSVSTLANDAPPDYIEELTKCQYYSRVIEVSGYFAFGIAAGSAHIQTPLQYAMRAKPSVSFTGSIALFGANDLTVSSIVVSAWGPSAICLDFITTGATSRTPYIINMKNAKIILSADL